MTWERPEAARDRSREPDPVSAAMRDLWKQTISSAVVSGALAGYVVFAALTYDDPGASQRRSGTFPDWFREVGADATVTGSTAAALMAMATVLSVAVVMSAKRDGTPMDRARSGMLADLSAIATFATAVVAWIGVAVTSVHLPRALLPLILFVAIVPVSSGLWALHGPDQWRLRQSVHQTECRIRAANNALVRRGAPRDVLRWRSSFPWNLVLTSSAGYFAIVGVVSWVEIGRPAWRASVTLTVGCLIWSCLVVQWSANHKTSKEISGKVPLLDWDPSIPTFVVIPILVSLALFGGGRLVAGGLTALLAAWPVIPGLLDDRGGRSHLVAYRLQRRRDRLRASLVSQKRTEHLMREPEQEDCQRRPTFSLAMWLVLGMLIALVAARRRRGVDPRRMGSTACCPADGQGRIHVRLEEAICALLA